MKDKPASKSVSQKHAAQNQIRKLVRLARRRASRVDAEDAVASALARFWETGCRWSEGRLVLEVRNRVRNARRAQQARSAREDLYQLTTVDVESYGGTD